MKTIKEIAKELEWVEGIYGIPCIGSTKYRGITILQFPNIMNEDETSNFVIEIQMSIYTLVNNEYGKGYMDLCEGEEEGAKGLPTIGTIEGAIKFIDEAIEEGLINIEQGEGE